MSYRIGLETPEDACLRALYNPEDFEYLRKLGEVRVQLEIFIEHEVQEQDLGFDNNDDYVCSSESGDESSECSLEDEDLENLNDDELFTARKNLIASKKGYVNSKSNGVKRRGYSYNYSEHGRNVMGGERDM